MAAGGLQPAAEPGGELEAWYQDLQEVLAAAEPGAPSPPWGAEQAEPAPPWHREAAGGPPGGCELDAALAAELRELLGPESAPGPEAAGTAPGGCSPPRLGAPEQEEDAAAAERGVKRRRRGSAGRELAKRRERDSEQRVRELTAHNERLREEIGRLSAEVARTRAALIDRIVNLGHA